MPTYRSSCIVPCTTFNALSAQARPFARLPILADNAHIHIVLNRAGPHRKGERDLRRHLPAQERGIVLIQDAQDQLENPLTLLLIPLALAARSCRRRIRKARQGPTIGVMALHGH